MNKLLAISAVALMAASGQAFAADPIMPAPVVPGPVVDSSSIWDGFYAGANIGYGWADAEIAGVDIDTDIDGWIGGAQLGYNIDLDGIVVGIEGDYQYSDISFEEAGLEGGINHFGTVRARVGADLGGFLPYLTAGVAFGELGLEGGGDEFTEYGWGWAAGAGVEALVTDNVSIKGEYLYTSFNDVEFDDLGGAEVDAEAHIARIGLNFHF